MRASLVVHWLRVCFAVPGTQVRSLVREDPTSHGATKSEDNNKDPVQPNLIKNQQNIKQKKNKWNMYCFMGANAIEKNQEEW